MTQLIDGRTAMTQWPSPVMTQLCDRRTTRQTAQLTQYYYWPVSYCIIDDPAEPQTQTDRPVDPDGDWPSEGPDPGQPSWWTRTDGPSQPVDGPWTQTGPWPSDSPDPVDGRTDDVDQTLTQLDYCVLVNWLLLLFIGIGHYWPSYYYCYYYYYWYYWPIYCGIIIIVVTQLLLLLLIVIIIDYYLLLLLLIDWLILMTQCEWPIDNDPDGPSDPIIDPVIIVVLLLCVDNDPVTQSDGRYYWAQLKTQTDPVMKLTQYWPDGPNYWRTMKPRQLLVLNPVTQWRTQWPLVEWPDRRCGQAGPSDNWQLLVDS